MSTPQETNKATARRFNDAANSHDVELMCKAFDEPLSAHSISIHD